MRNKNRILEPLAVSVFCRNIAVMQEAGISLKDSVAYMINDSESGPFQNTLQELMKHMESGEKFSSAIKESHMFPLFAANMIEIITETSSYSALINLAEVYERQHTLKEKLKSALIYPIILLLLMCLVLLLMVSVVLPVFKSVYADMPGVLASGSYSYITASSIIAWVCLLVTICISIAVIICYIASRTTKGSRILLNCAENFVFTRAAYLQMAVSQFTDMLTLFTAVGKTSNVSIMTILPMIEHNGLKAKVEQISKEIALEKNLADSITEHHIYPALYGRMLAIALKNKNINSMSKIAAMIGEDASEQIQRLISTTEPILTGILTLVVGITLLSIMLPLIGMLNAIG